MLADGITIGCGTTISQYRADEYLSVFVVNFIFSFPIGFGSGLDIIKYQHSSKPCRWQ
jgi:hypothetical protein